MTISKYFFDHRPPIDVTDFRLLLSSDTRNMPRNVSKDFPFFYNNLRVLGHLRKRRNSLALLDAILLNRKESCETGLELDGAE